MGRLFGTDGVRGVANSQLTPQMAYKLGKAGAEVLGRQQHKSPQQQRKPRGNLQAQPLRAGHSRWG